ncbi:ras guanine nucleotide exchange factor domain-containing protein [Dichotomocladium elegans]|nr:ras guanine nucleotide exchange factor domain-containing protein [Dichotomocladium elegans]
MSRSSPPFLQQSPPPPLIKVWQLKRRSKSVGDLGKKRSTVEDKLKTYTREGHFHYDDASLPASFDHVSALLSATEQRPRRHVSCCGSSAKDCFHVKTVNGCVPNDKSVFHETKMQALVLRNKALFENQIAGPYKLPKMFTRPHTVGSAPIPRLSRCRRSSNSLRHQPSDTASQQPTPKGIVSAIIAAANSPADNQSSLGWVGVEEKDPTPTPPIENDPHVFDVLIDHSSQFITFSKRDDNPNVVNSATIEKLVEKLTNDIDSELILVFFLTYRQFLTGIKLCKLLILRFRWALMQDTDDRLSVRIRTFVVIRYWLTHYWQHDFATSRTLRFMLSTFLSQLRTHPLIMASPRNAHIIESLRNIFKRQRSFFNSARNPRETRSVRSSVFAPPLLHQHVSAIDSVKDIQRRLKSSVSTPALSFLSRARRHSTNSQRSVNENNAWSARLNFRLKTIKRSVPAMYSNVVGSSHHQRQEPEPNTLNVNRQHTHQTATNPTLTPGHNCSPHSDIYDPPISSPTPECRSSDRSNSFPTPTPLYHPLILRYRSELISQQFCLIEQQMLQDVTWNELVELRWRNRNKRSTSPIEEYRLDALGVEQLINYFNMACQWIASEVVQTQSLDTRVLVVEKYIRIALKCYHHRNYSTLMQILLGLQSPAVTRLEKTWQRIDQYEIQIFNELKELAKPFLNWKNIRAAMSEALESIDESSALESVLTRSHMNPAEIKGIQGCIPFLGLYLSDLVFNSELPTVIALDTHQNETTSFNDIDNDDDDAELCSRLSTHLINYNKCRITASIVKHVMAFQVLSRAYIFQQHPELYNQLKNLAVLDNAEIYRISLLCED